MKKLYLLFALMMVGLVVAGSLTSKDLVLDKSYKDSLKDNLALDKYTLSKEDKTDTFEFCMGEKDKLNTCNSFSKTYKNCTPIYINVEKEVCDEPVCNEICEDILNEELKELEKKCSQICDEPKCRILIEQQENGTTCETLTYTEEEITIQSEVWQKERLELIADALKSRDKIKQTKEELLITIK